MSGLWIQMTQDRTCVNCGYSTDIRIIKDKVYVFCRNPENYVGIKESEANLACWQEKLLYR